MNGGMKRGGFFAGAIGGLALALLLVGVVSSLPPSNPTFQAGPAPDKGATAAFYGAAATATSTTTVLSTSTTTSSSAPSTTAQSGAQGAATSTPAMPSAAVTTTVGATTTIAAGSTTTVITTAAANALSANTPTIQGVANVASGGEQQQRPNSLLTMLPGESIGGLIATLSPLLIGLLVAALIYGAYVRRQDSSS